MPLWREISWVGFGGGDLLSGEAAPISGNGTEAPPLSGDAPVPEVTQGPDAGAARIGPVGPPAVTERPSDIGREAKRRAGALPAAASTPSITVLRQARAGFDRVVRIAAVAASMGVVAVIAYHGGERLAGLVSLATSAPVPGDPMPPRAAAERGRMAAVALAAAPPHGAAVETPSGPAADYLARATAGDVTAQFNIAVLYAKGDGVTPDLASAARWFRKAAAAGSEVAQFNLAVMYERGLGVAQNAAEAISWYRRAAAHNYPPAQYNLALVYAEGRGLPQDMAAAAHWYRLAASRGLVPAMVNLAILYETGDGVERSLTDAYGWYRAAARARDGGAERRARELLQQFAGADKGKAVLAAAAVVDAINQPLARREPADHAPASEPAAVRPAAASTDPTDSGESAITLKPGGSLKRAVLGTKLARPRPNG